MDYYNGDKSLTVKQVDELSKDASILKKIALPMIEKMKTLELIGSSEVINEISECIVKIEDFFCKK